MNDESKSSMDETIAIDKLANIYNQDVILKELQREEEVFIDKLINIYKQKIEIKRLKNSLIESVDIKLSCLIFFETFFNFLPLLRFNCTFYICIA